MKYHCIPSIGKRDSELSVVDIKPTLKQFKWPHTLASIIRRKTNKLSSAHSKLGFMKSYHVMVVNLSFKEHDEGYNNHIGKKSILFIDRYNRGPQLNSQVITPRIVQLWRMPLHASCIRFKPFVQFNPIMTVQYVIISDYVSMIASVFRKVQI